MHYLATGNIVVVVAVVAKIPINGALAVVATAMLALMLVALGSFAYESLTGDGITWPNEHDGTGDEATEDEDIERGRTDDEWEYY